MKEERFRKKIALKFKTSIHVCNCFDGSDDTFTRLPALMDGWMEGGWMDG